MMNYEIVKAPIITEKSVRKAQDENVYTFEVAQGVNKIQIKNAIEEIFDVKVERVNVINSKAKTKRLGKYVGKTSRVRKALVKLAEGNSIEIV